MADDNQHGAGHSKVLPRRSTAQTQRVWLPTRSPRVVRSWLAPMALRASSSRFHRQNHRP